MPPLYWTLPVGLGCGIWHLSWVKGCVWSANAQQSIGSPWWRTAPMPLVWCWTSASNQTHVLTTFYRSIGRSYTYWRLVLLSWSLCWATHKLRFYLTWRTFHLLTATALIIHIELGPRDQLSQNQLPLSQLPIDQLYTDIMSTSYEIDCNVTRGICKFQPILGTSCYYSTRYKVVATEASAYEFQWYLKLLVWHCQRKGLALWRLQVPKDPWWKEVNILEMWEAKSQCPARVTTY